VSGLDRESIVQLYLFMSIIFLSLLVRLFISDSSLFIDAIFATMYTPVVYTMSYYTKQARMSEGEYVKRKKPEFSRLIMYELVALIASYMVGYLMFYALTLQTDYYIYTVAYVTSQTMRIMNLAIIRMFKRLDIDPSHPFLMLIGSGATAFLHLILLQFLLQPL